MQNFECLKDIIGVTKDFSQCLHGQLTNEEFQALSVSRSGLYLDGVEGGVLLRNVPNPNNIKPFIKYQTDAIENAKKFFTADILAELNLKYQVKKTNFIGEIGKVSYVGSMAVNSRLQFLKVQAKNDAILHVDRFRVFLNMDITTKVWVVKIEEGQSQGVIVYENENVTSDNKIITVIFEEDLKLPLSINGRKQDYYFVYEKLDSALQPRDIKTSCGCAGGDAYSEFLIVGGGEAETFSDLGFTKNDLFTHGISISVQIKCETGSVICKEYNENDAIAYVTAFALLYKSAELVIESIMNSGIVDRFTMLSREHLWGKRTHFKKEYNDRVKYLSGAIDVTSSDCFLCRDDTMYLGNILN